MFGIFSHRLHNILYICCYSAASLCLLLSSIFAAFLLFNSQFADIVFIASSHKSTSNIYVIHVCVFVLSVTIWFYMYILFPNFCFLHSNPPPECVYWASTLYTSLKSFRSLLLIFFFWYFLSLRIISKHFFRPPFHHVAVLFIWYLLNDIMRCHLQDTNASNFLRKANKKTRWSKC